jgi:hypothetical protein
MTTLLTLVTLLTLAVGQPRRSDVKVSIKISPAKPVADGRTLFTVMATVTDAKGRPVAGATVRFNAHGYMEGPNGNIVGRYDHMRRGADYRVLLGGGLCTGPKAPLTNALNVNADQKGVARVSYKPWSWAGYMKTVPTRVTAWYQVDGTGQAAASTDISFIKPKK